MSDDALERGDDAIPIDYDGWHMLWDGTPGGWIRARPGCRLEYWR